MNEEDKEKASEILEGLGTNLSAVTKMMVKQIIINGSIPFKVSLDKVSYTPEEQISEVSSTMSLEDMPLPEDRLQLLRDYQAGKITGEEYQQAVLKFKK